MSENIKFRQKLLYLDHAGATLPDDQQLHEYYEFLMANTLANPHSHGYLGNNLNNIIDESRQLILQHFGADSNEYSVIFTSGATGSIKLIGECFPWTSKSVYAYPYNSHTSIIGLREYASSVYCIPSNSLRNLTSNEQSGTENRTIGDREGYSLLAIPGECNFSGTKYSPYVISQLFSQISEKYLLTLKSSQVKFTNNTAESETNWLWLLDASKLASTHSINISLDYSPFHRPDFICCSFYKIFGFPTGIGALLVKKKVAHLLQKRYFGGGSVNSVAADKNWMMSAASLHTKFEDGTLNYHGIAALKYGFRALDRAGGMLSIQQHTFRLCQYLFDEMSKLKHTDTSHNLCTIYGNHSLRDSSLQGSIISFNLMWSNGSWIGFNEVERLAIENNIQLRTGCFCCIGGCQEAFSITGEQVQYNVLLGRSCQNTSADLINGLPTGAVRISVGYMTTLDDCNCFLQFLIDNFLNKSPETLIENEYESQSTASITTLYIYPIKSCAGISVTRWPLSSSGFYLDRMYALRNSISGRTLTLKNYPKLALCSPYITFGSDWLMIYAPNMMTVLGIHTINNQVINIPIDQLSLTSNISDDSRDLLVSVLYESFLSYIMIHHPTLPDHLEITSESINLCFDCTNAIQISSIADQWFSQFLQIPCSLVKQDLLHTTTNSTHEKSFTNNGQFLMISKQSLENLQDKLVISAPYQSPSKDKEDRGEEINSRTPYASPSSLQVTEKKFRPNIVVNCPNGQPHEEDSWTHLIVNVVEYSPDDPSPSTTSTSTPVTFLLTSPCTRCTVINIHPENGQKDQNIYKILSNYRKDKDSQILFGQYLAYQADIQHLLNHHQEEETKQQQQQQQDTRASTRMRSWLVMDIQSPCQILRRKKEILASNISTSTSDNK